MQFDFLVIIIAVYCVEWPTHSRVSDCGKGQTQNCGRVKPVNEIPTLPLLITASLTACMMYNVSIQ
jgi:hypothetical protein